MKHFLILILLLISLAVSAHQSSLSSATINGTQFTLHTTNCTTFHGGTNLPISVTFKQISNFSGNVNLTVNVIITDRTDKTVITVPNVFLNYNISTQFYTVNLAPLNLKATDLYSFQFDAIVVYPNQSDSNANNKSSLNTCPNPLPVELVSFNGVVNHNDVTLSWVTASEKNSSYFIVECTTDGIAFAFKGRVAAAGSSTQEHTYALKTNILGDTYFRLKSVDTDGSYSYSSVLLLRAKLLTQYSVGFGERFISFNILAGDTPVKLSVIDMTGRLLYEVNASHYLLSQPQNLVILRLVTSSGLVYNKRY